MRERERDVAAQCTINLSGFANKFDQNRPLGALLGARLEYKSLGAA